MRFKAAVAAVLLMIAGVSWASVIHSLTLANETALSANKTYQVDLNKSPVTKSNSGIDRLSAQAVYSISAGSTATYAGNVSMQWLGSNDGANYNALNVSSVTYLASAASSSTATSSLWDFGFINYHYLQLSVVAPSSGTINLVVTVNEKY